ncbi:MAG: rhomboid family intramembrane serine protease, partial [Ruminococcaceae bacterium]|nr:rhomboid family intramembrane serine protease [Oscillospiraceae bacterium]
TPMLLHAGVEHLFFNSFSLLIWGRMLEGLLGHWRFFIVYLL